MEALKNSNLAMRRKFLEEKTKLFMKPLVEDIIDSDPSDLTEFIIQWCVARQRRTSARQPLTDCEIVRSVNMASQKSVQPISEVSSRRLLANPKPSKLPETSESSGNENDVLDMSENSHNIWVRKRLSVVRKKMGISAEVCPKENLKDFQPKVVPKTKRQVQRIKAVLAESFMFNGLDERSKQAAIDAMEVKKYSADEFVIQQGEDGNELFIVDKGLLRCTLRPKKGDEEVFIKNYKRGDLFGELALMYNTPRAASIRALKPSKLFSLNRSIFNSIAKGSTISQREKYEAFLSRVGILDNLHLSEKLKICDCLVTERFAKGDFIIRQGDVGDKFYLIEEGTAEAIKSQGPGNEAKVFDYKENDYFGELALLGNNIRKASIRVTSDQMVVASLDRQSFKRLLGPLEAILQRNSDRYQKYGHRSK